MIVTVNYQKQLRAAYEAGAVAMALFLKNNGPKPDAEKYLSDRTRQKPIAKF